VTDPRKTGVAAGLRAGDAGKGTALYWRSDNTLRYGGAIDNGRALTCAIYSLRGSLVAKTSLPSAAGSISLGLLPPGPYLVRIASDRTLASRYIVVGEGNRRR
jgi:hypothetical protein